MKWIAVIAILFGSMQAFGQEGRLKDTLQIKVYSSITYKNNRAKDIKIRKVFCDYCSEKQLTHLTQEGYYRAYQERNLPENRMKNGVNKLTILIFIAKSDFKALNNE